MELKDVQLRSDGGYYAIVDGKDREFVGDGDNAVATCQHCGSSAECLSDCETGSLLICESCFKNARAAQ